MAERWAVGLFFGIPILLVAISILGGDVSSLYLPRPTEGYRAVYRIEDSAGEDSSVRTEIVEVRRPYDGRVENRRGDPPGGTITTGKVSNREFGWQLDDGGALQFGLRRPAGGPTRDVSYAALVDAARAGVIVVSGNGSALGRRCTWFAFDDPFPEPLTPPTATSRVEACVDPSGIVLREVWTIRDEVVRVTEVVELTLHPPSSDRFLEGRDPRDARVTQPEARNLVGSQVVVGDDVGGEPPRLALDPPSGWKRDRNAQVVQAAATGQATRFASLAYRNGLELVVVEIGMLPSFEPTWQWSEGEAVEVEGATKARVQYFGDHVEVRVLRDEGFVRINAPSLRTALAFAQGLRSRT